MLSEGFFDILSHASGWVAGKSRQALARHNSLSGKGLLLTSPSGTCWRGRLTPGARILLLQSPSFADRIGPLLPRSIERGPVEANRCDPSFRLEAGPSALN